MITLSLLITFVVALLTFSIIYSLFIGVGSLLYLGLKVLIFGVLFAFVYWIVTEIFN
jgi:hypothetical protein